MKHKYDIGTQFTGVLSGRKLLVINQLELAGDSPWYTILFSDGTSLVYTEKFINLKLEKNIWKLPYKVELNEDLFTL